MAIVDASGIPDTFDVQSATLEVKLVENTIKSRFVGKPPDLMIGDKDYESFENLAGLPIIRLLKNFLEKPVNI